MAKKNKKDPLPTLSPGITVVDSHCHLDMAAYDADREEVINSALAAGVGRLITIGIDLESSRMAVELAERHPAVFATVGVHPHNVAELTNSGHEEFRTLAVHNKVVAYGEIGLDFVKLYNPPNLQLIHFRRQVKLARELHLPLIIHDREAHQEIMEVLEKEAPFPAGGVMHCFSGDPELADRVLALGFHISIPGVVTFNKAATLQEVTRTVPISSLILETDAPFLAPVPWRGRRNLPSYVLYTARKIAELKDIPLDDLARQTTENAVKLFNLEKAE